MHKKIEMKTSIVNGFVLDMFAVGLLDVAATMPQTNARNEVRWRERDEEWRAAKCEVRMDILSLHTDL